MTMVNKKSKMTCFFCQYEICTPLPHRQLQYKNTLKPICKQCKPAEHKACQKRFAHCHIDCSICTKAVKYNKCIECSICNHLVHANCSELTNTDIKTLEGLKSTSGEPCSGFICRVCITNIFPFGISKIETCQEKASKNKDKPLKKVCFACPNVVNNRKYRGKQIIYNSNYEELCRPCSMLKLSLPVKDPKLIEIVDCSICNETVQYEGVLCDTCQCWVHPACNGLTPLDIKELNDTQTTWQCNKCNPPPQSSYTNKNEKLKLYFETFDDCKMCQKPVKTNQSICCALCRHWIHGKCLRIFRKGEFKQFNDKLKHTDWYCPKCMDENLPFHNLSDEELAFHCFESNNVHIDTSSEQMKVIFKQLNQSNMFDKHIFDNDDANSRQYDNDITNMDPDAHFSYKDCCKYVFNL